MTAIVAGVVCVTVLAALVVVVVQRRWELSRKAEGREMALAEFRPRIEALEKAVKDAEWAKGFAKR
jgi:hypothetical protein